MESIADHFTAGQMSADAKRGSALLRNAIFRSLSPKRRTKSELDYSKRIEKRYGSWEDRQLAMAQVERLQRVVADHYGLPHRLMAERRGVREVAEKRQIAMFLARSIIQSSYPDIGKCFGGKDHTTVIHACRVVAGRPRLAEEAVRLRMAIGA